MAEKILRTTKKIDAFGDLQGVLPWGHSYMPWAKYVLLNIPEGATPVKFLKELMPEITGANERPGKLAMNIAFTHSGLARFGLPESTLDNFSREFKEGMNIPYRTFLLGDFGNNAPENWQWGAPQQDEVHISLMIFSIDKNERDKAYDDCSQTITNHGLKTLIALDSETLSDNKEHFGFRDGIGQPTYDGIPKKNPSPSVIATGEVLLGYKNQYDQYGRNAIVTEAKGDPSVLPTDQSGSGSPSFGQNGSYLVFRQLSQDVNLFWEFLKKEATTDGNFDKGDMIRYGSKMVGRWPNGAPMALFPDHEPNNADPNKFDLFYYNPEDQYGYNCPRGSHLRRSNPRDAIAPNPEGSLRITDKHRLLRRGRPYGPPVVSSMNPEEILEKGPDNIERGLVFIAFCSDISRQYEFTQRAWTNSPKFDDLYDEADPVAGNHYKSDECPLETDNFTIQGCPVRHRMNDLPNFIKTEGGAYFFLPGMSALEYLTTL